MYKGELEPKDGQGITLASVRTALDQAFHQPDQPVSLEAMEDWITQLGQPRMLVPLLQATLADEEALHDIAHHSRLHPLGFDKFSLLRTPDYELRLHIWWPDSGIAATEDVHNHRFDLASHVTHGTLHSQVFERDDNGDRVLLEYESTAQRGNPYAFESKGPARLRLKGTMDVQQGQSYTLGHDTFHRITNNPTVLTATLMLRTADLVPSDTVFKEQPITEPDRLVKVALSANDVRTRFRRFLAGTARPGIPLRS